MKYTLWRRAAAAFLSLFLLCGLCSPGAFADAEMRRVVVGADLTEEQIASVYTEYGIRRGDVPELRLTNAEEHAALDGYVDAAIIGTRSMSCVYLELLGQGSGMNVTVKNISWCTPEMYINALSTAGITDARIAVVAPFAVSGTAALAGIYKAYEDMTGQKLDAVAKDVSTQELTITGELANEIGSADSTSIVNDLKLMLNETVNMSDEELRSTIRRIAGTYHVTLTETQVQQLVDLCRSLEKLDAGTLTQRVEDIQSTLEKVSEAKDQVVGFFQTIRNAFAAVKDFFDRLSSLFGGR
ncbi:MAG: DUF1002 domain-containing protein [Oscillospiraceae bacterium]|nr:DUF1002 domain-containing protein [Oscillospiraceae bacterium]